MQNVFHFLTLSMLKILGRTPSAGQRAARIAASPYYQNGAFRNIEPTTVQSADFSILKLLRQYMNKPADIRAKAIPSVQPDFNVQGKDIHIIWLGHSSYWIYAGGTTILVDPVLSGYASPFSFIMRSFPGSDPIKPAHIPPVDIVLITHDHYDHLDYECIRQIKAGQYIMPLGVGEHLEYWGISPALITELDWYQSHRYHDKGITFTALPSRHFSGRSLRRAQTLWAAFLLDLPGGRRIFAGGDSGYDARFKEIGWDFPGIDLAILDGAQYGEGWPLIHMKPEQTAQAAMDLGTKALLPVHWGKFNLSLHPWKEPVQRLLKAAQNMPYHILLPSIGQRIGIDERREWEKWWEKAH
jgi:L-ascorbate metabolism protein UlaG (beta-lactamase superfamily)